jgi:histidine triad (HIT) family protein
MGISLTQHERRSEGAAAYGMPMEACFVCAKHLDLARAAPGGALDADAHVVVSHLPLTTPAGDASSVYLGHLLVEPRRHIAELGDLRADEAASFGALTARASAALQAVGAEHVYAAVIGHGVAHLHLHLIARYPGTPREYWWTRLDEWTEAPRGDTSAVADFVARLRANLRP